VRQAALTACRSGCLWRREPTHANDGGRSLRSKGSGLMPVSTRALADAGSGRGQLLRAHGWVATSCMAECGSPCAVAGRVTEMVVPQRDHGAR